MPGCLPRRRRPHCARAAGPPRWLALPPAYAGLAVLLMLAAVMPAAVIGDAAADARQAAPLGLAVIGQSLVMRGRSIDLSSGGRDRCRVLPADQRLLPDSDAVAMVACVALGLVVGGSTVR